MGVNTNAAIAAATPVLGPLPVGVSTAANVLQQVVNSSVSLPILLGLKITPVQPNNSGVPDLALDITALKSGQTVDINKFLNDLASFPGQVAYVAQTNPNVNVQGALSAYSWVNIRPVIVQYYGVAFAQAIEQSAGSNISGESTVNNISTPNTPNVQDTINPANWTSGGSASVIQQWINANPGAKDLPPGLKYVNYLGIVNGQLAFQGGVPIINPNIPIGFYQQNTLGDLIKDLIMVPFFPIFKLKG